MTHSSATNAESVAPDADDVAANKKRFAWTFTGLMLAMLLAALDQTIVATALPTIVGDLNGLESLSWVVTAYLLAGTIGLPIYGKAGDLFGRKPVFVFAIVVFLIGSILAGLSQNMTELIAFRAIQGIGGGGLMIGAQAILADIVAPRDRGRYMGYMGAVFGLSSVGGPLIGGYLTDHAGWRWVFYINMPLGLLALGTVIVALHVHRPVGAKPRLDYLGTALLAAASTAIVFVSSWGGGKYDWASPEIFGLSAAAIVCAFLFVIVERRAAEPILPLSLFRERNFVIPTAVGITVAIAMFATVSYLPTYFQMVNGANATKAGLMLIPMIVGLLLTSIVTGRLISSTGKYKIYPILGAVVAAGGLVLLSRMNVDSSFWFAALGMFVAGLGIGCSMQNLVLITQNSVAHRVLGVATSSTNYFRQIGASLGIAVFGSLFVSRLTDALVAGHVDTSQIGAAGVSSLTPAVLSSLPAPAQEGIAQAFSTALPPIFLYGVPIVLLGLVLALFVKVEPLAEASPDGTREMAASPMA